MKTRPRPLRNLAVVVAVVAACGTSSPPPSTRAEPTVSAATTQAATNAATSEPSFAPELPIGSWTATGNLVAARSEHTATRLRDGRILIAGGSIGDGSVELASAELYDPATGQWATTGSMHVPRSRHTATLLADGRVVVAGGFCDPGGTKGCPALEDQDGAIAAAEIYDPKTGTWSQTDPMTTTRFLHTATLLGNGKVLVVGAEHSADAILDSAELFDPKTGKWTATGSMHQARTQNVAASLPDGRVLVAGGIGPVSRTSATPHDLLASTELYEPSSGTWAETGSLITKRAFGGTATALADGQVMFVGGDGPGDPQLASAEIYNPKSGTWTETGNLANARDLLTSTLLGDGRVLVAGGFIGTDAAGYTEVPPAELWDPETGAWAFAGDLPSSRVLTTAVLLISGEVLVAGGTNATGPLASSVLYAS